MDMLPDLFFTINFSISIMMSLATVTVSLIMIVLYITQQRCHSITNLLISNTSVFIALYSLGNLVSSAFGLRQDWAENQPACIFRADFFIFVCGSICYSYLMPAISRLLFVVFFQTEITAQLSNALLHDCF
jgi:hypothetical protein